MAVRCSTLAAHSSGRVTLQPGLPTREDMTVAADPDPYFALPKLYGAPAYARPPRVVPESERPIDPDDLPIVAEQTEEERALASVVFGPADYRSADDLPATGPSPTPGASGANGNGASGSIASGGGGVIGRRFSLRALAGRRDTAAK
jgi:hypothetical protein